LKPFAPLAGARSRSVAAAAARYGRFLGRTARTSDLRRGLIYLLEDSVTEAHERGRDGVAVRLCGHYRNTIAGIAA
jgi:hypothetical protein